ncbi:MAG: HU family DNA-binding protein [Spirochaetales bacterium]|nr:HU family DNA-binding protein [Spirochaetales bacterium]
MGETFNQLPENIQVHLRKITESSGLPNTEESAELIAVNWVEKKDLFKEQIKLLGMNEVDIFKKDDERPVLLLTYSGSLISLGALAGGKRWIEYASIKLRSDVPNVVNVPESALEDDIQTDAEAVFTQGKIKQTSSLLKIAVCSEEIPVEEQEKRIREAMIFLTNSFTKANRKITASRGETPDNFTMKSIIRYIASKNNITQKLTGQILDDFLFILESGMLLGERIPLGRMGKLFIKKRAAQKARVSINPHTQEEMLIPAKPEMFVPKISFSKMIKEKVKTVDIDDIEDAGDEKESEEE